MPEIIKAEAPPLLHFGKHKGRTAAEVMQIDPAYVDWVLEQPWFQEKNPQLVQFFIHGGAIAPETPEHNALQAKFSHDAYCMAVAAMFSAGQQLQSAAFVRESAEQMLWPAATGNVRGELPSISERQFERYAWDVRFTFTGASANYTGTEEPDCACTPLDVPDLPEEPMLRDYMRDLDDSDERGCAEARAAFDHDHAGWMQERGRRDTASRTNGNRVASRFHPDPQGAGSMTWDRYVEATRKKYLPLTEHEDGCPRSTVGYLIAWPLRERELIEGAQARFGLELKPTMGDDYPAVLRQVQGYLDQHRSGARIDRAAVVVGAFHSAAVPWTVVKKQFWESNVLLIEESEIDALVEANASVWGAPVAPVLDDFTVQFTDQL